MLCKSAHNAVTNPVTNKNEDCFIPGDYAWGDINGFIKKYHEAFSINHYNKLKDYMARYDKYKKKNKMGEMFVNNITNWAYIIKEAK
jgi:hypothetical protein